MFERTYIGLDVHARSIVGCALNIDTGELTRSCFEDDLLAVSEWVQGFGPEVRVVYEAGPTGFGLARHFQAAGIDCVIAAPSKLLRAPGDRVKTDRRDAKILASMLALGEVTKVTIPDTEQEALRDLSRTRHVASIDLSHAKQRVNAILLRHGVLFHGGKSRWTREHLKWLHQQHFDDPALEFAFQESLAQEESMSVRLKRIDKEVARVAANCRYTEVINALACLRGFSIVGAFGLATEIGDWTRFTGATIGSYLGLVPSEHSSGETRTQGSITKAGNTYARHLLVEAATVHKRPYRRPGVQELRQLELVSPATAARARQGNQRLHARAVAFDDRHKMPVKARTAVARELAGWCWSLAAPLQEGRPMTGR
jgi:transposase